MSFAAEVSRTKSVVGWRLCVFLLVAAFMVGGPAYRQVLGGESRIFRHWIMFSGVGSGVIDAEFHEIQRDGREVRVDPRLVIGGPGASRDDLPRGVWLIRKKTGGVGTVVGHLCHRSEEGAMFRVNARIATRKGWRPLHTDVVLSCNEGI